MAGQTEGFDPREHRLYGDFVDWFVRTFPVESECWFFSPDELLVHVGDVRRGAVNQFPPQKLWGNVIATLRLLNRLRDYLGKPVIITSAYRSPEYNQVVGGVKNSQHLKFNALDFKVKGGKAQLERVAKLLRSWRKSEYFSGGIGIYPTFIHVDTRGWNATWKGG